MASNTRDRESDLVQSLTNLVNAATNRISPSSSADTIKRLYPSTAGCRASTTQSSMSSKTLSSPSSSSAIIPPPPQSSSSATNFWQRNAKSNKRKASSAFGKEGKALKISDCLKDVFLINSPRVNFVPRKSDREFYYSKGLVASAIRFHSGMDSEAKVRVEISSHFQQCHALLFPEFEFVKAVGDTLVRPNCSEMNYRTLKHIYGHSGPIYIRTTKAVDADTFDVIKDDDDDEETDSSEVKLQGPSRIEDENHNKGIYLNCFRLPLEIFAFSVLRTNIFF